MTTNQKPTLQHFVNVHFKFTPKPESNLNIPPFNYKQAGDLEKYNVNGHDDVSKQVSNACRALTVQTDLAVLKELCIICHHYDSKNEINWQNTTTVIQKTLSKLHYKQSFVNEFTEQIKTLTGTESVFK